MARIVRSARRRDLCPKGIDMIRVTIIGSKRRPISTACHRAYPSTPQQKTWHTQIQSIGDGRDEGCGRQPHNPSNAPSRTPGPGIHDMRVMRYQGPRYCMHVYYIMQLCMPDPISHTIWARDHRRSDAVGYGAQSTGATARRLRKENSHGRGVSGKSRRVRDLMITDRSQKWVPPQPRHAPQALQPCTLRPL